MPELPEVETVRLGLQPVMEDATFAAVEQRRPDLRVPFPPRFAARLKGRTVTGLGRRGKYLTADLDDGTVLVIHLGMSGSLRVEAEDGSVRRAGLTYRAPGKREAHDHVVFHMSSGVRIVFNDPRRFGLMDLVRRGELEQSRHFRAMGVEPLGNAFDGGALAERLAGRKTSVKSALIDQRLIAGLGNIYACEALWRARISPTRPAGRLASKTGKATTASNRLADAIRSVLHDAIRAGGSSLRDHVRTDGELGEFQHTFAVYDRKGEPCPRPECGGTVRAMVQAGRTTFYCPACQP